jgi:DNA-binding GntR family transcriptional regulator
MDVVTSTPRQPRGTVIYLDLLSRLQRGAVSAGERLVDTNLAAELGVSRMPVREALLRLVHEGYLVGTTRGFMLPQLSEQDIADIFEVRRLLEPRAAGAAALALDEFGMAGLDAARQKARAAVAAQDGIAFMTANMRFREIWLQAVPNERLATTISRFADHVQAIRIATLHDHRSQVIALEMLDNLLGSFRRRDMFDVHDCMARLIDQARERFFALLPVTKQDVTGARAGAPGDAGR